MSKGDKDNSKVKRQKAKSQLKANNCCGRFPLPGFDFLVMALTLGQVMVAGAGFLSFEI
jgi:hypothetical protein